MDLLFVSPIRFREDQGNEGLKLDGGGTTKTTSEEGIYSVRDDRRQVYIEERGGETLIRLLTDQKDWKGKAGTMM